MPPLDPDDADLAPTGPALTAYDEEHAVTYIRMLDADQEGADWREVSRIVLHMARSRRPTERGVPSTAISREPKGGTGRIPATASRRRLTLLITRAEPTNSRGDHLTASKVQR
jgi:hypothetical protein